VTRAAFTRPPQPEHGQPTGAAGCRTARLDVFQTPRASNSLTVRDAGPVTIDRAREARCDRRVEPRDLSLHRGAVLWAHVLQ
jgi:hypothetical protein